MCLLIESIRIQNRKLQNIEAHNIRLNKSRADLFGRKDKLDLRNCIEMPDALGNGIYKCRVLYSEKIHEINIHPYKQRIVRNLELVDGGDINYEYKYLDRSCLDVLKTKSNADDILIVKNGYISDTSFANIVLFDGKKWVTPSTPLLKGTKRQSLLETGRVSEYEIKEKCLPDFISVILINAMLELNMENCIPVENIFRI